MLTRPLLVALITVALAEPPLEPDAPAGPDPTAIRQAEYIRLSDELARYFQRQTWAGAQRTFGELEALGVPLDFEDYLAGAHAARQLGEMNQVYDRLTQAARLQPDREVVDWLWSIDQSYGQVALRTEPARGNSLDVSAMPFAPDQRSCVETARGRVAETGAYVGLLPAGEYVFGEQAFTVAPGQVPVELTVAPTKGRKPRDR
ncbi:MAG: hypothetical protein H6739_24140 [Alphaproteobacteria bacterium]|nr:hypothetical protein [Alphaproteobacteria bacterium]